MHNNRNKKKPLKISTICFTILSSLFLIILLVGNLKFIYLSRFTFDESIQTVIKKQQISFTLYSYCIDDGCFSPSLIHNFDQCSINFIINYILLLHLLINRFF